MPDNKCFTCGGIGHYARECPNKGTESQRRSNQDDGNTPCGKWDDGTDQYFCIHHNKLVGHASKDCRLARGKTDNKYQPYPNREASRTPSATFVRETMAAAMPQFAKQLLIANIDKGVVLTFERTTTATDVEALRKAMPGLGLMYHHATTIIVETRTEEERTTIEKRLQGAQDHGKTITITRHDKEQPAEQKGPIQFGDPPPLQFGPAATTPSPTTASGGQPTPTPPGDGPTPMDTGSSAPSEGSTQPAATPMAPHTPGLDARMTTMENRMGDIEVRVNGMDGKLDQLIANSGGKRKAIVRPRANGSDMPDSYTAGATCWVVMKAHDTAHWAAHKITIITCDKNGFKGMPWSAENLPITDIDVIGTPSHVMKEEDAKNLALN